MNLIFSKIAAQKVQSEIITWQIRAIQTLIESTREQETIIQGNILIIIIRNHQSRIRAMRIFSNPTKTIFKIVGAKINTICQKSTKKNSLT